MEAFIGSIILFAGNFPPRGWQFCQGQILAISQNTALFSILGTTYGGNGQTTFALPDLRGRVPLGQGQGPGLTPRALGEMAGSENVTLLSTQMPAHNHLMTVTDTAGNQQNPGNHILAGESQSATQVYSDAAANATLNPAAIGVAGGNQPHNNMQPYLGLNYIICMEGIYPSRN